MAFKKEPGISGEGRGCSQDCFGRKFVRLDAVKSTNHCDGDLVECTVSFTLDKDF